MSDGCRGKRRYPTRGLAERAIRGIRKKGERHQKGKPGHAYLCQRCRGWHITSQPH